MMENRDWDDVLYVQMFGTFSMIWNGKELTGKAKSGETQFAYLMQAILHSGAKGITRDKLTQLIFGDREVTDPKHATRTVIYNAKKKLKAAGLPDMNYIEQKDGVYYWTPQIPVREDAAEMERLSHEAEEEQDPEKRLALYVRACHYYTAEFLESQTATIWIAQEARRYRALFCSCVEKAVDLMRASGEYFQMEELGLYAAQVNPLADWEAVTMEALVSLGRDEDARKFYDDTLELYLQEQGLHPSDKLMGLLDRLGAQMGHQYAVLDDIQESLSGNDEKSPGGYFCPYPVFRGIYQMVERMMERGGQSVYLMLCTVVDSKGNPMRDGPILEELSQRLESAIQQSVRRGDAVNRYGKGQYLVLLVNTTRENCKILQRRINYHFLVGRQRTGVQYYVNSVICTPAKERIH